MHLCVLHVKVKMKKRIASRAIQCIIAYYMDFRTSSPVFLSKGQVTDTLSLVRIYGEQQLPFFVMAPLYFSR